MRGPPDRRLSSRWWQGPTVTVAKGRGRGRAGSRGELSQIAWGGHNIMKSTSVWVRAVFSLAIFMLLPHVFPTYVRAQTTNGAILGAVHDASGAGIPGVKVVVKNTETGVTRSAITDGDGAYEVLSLPAGAYQVEASLQGFTTELRQGIALTVGASISVNFSLSVGDVVEKVVVNEDTPQVETTSSAVSGVVGEAAIRELPLNGRDWLQLATLQAGVIGGIAQQQPSQSTNSRAAFGNGVSLAIGGGRPTNNVYQ